MKRWKLTDENDRTHGGCQWSEGVEHTAPGGEPCTDGVIHWYADPLLAVLHDPIHGGYGETAHLWECEVAETGTDGLKCWGTRCRTLRQVPLPAVSTEQRTRYAIFCAMEVLPPPNTAWAEAWQGWAEGWLAGKDRSSEAARAAAIAARAAAIAVMASDAARAARAAWAAAWAAKEAWASRAAAWAAARAAEEARAKGKSIDLRAIALRAVSEPKAGE